jgi:hypothetical protein
MSPQGMRVQRALDKQVHPEKYCPGKRCLKNAGHCVEHKQNPPTNRRWCNVCGQETVWTDYGNCRRCGYDKNGAKR